MTTHPVGADLREVREGDIDAVCALNEAALPAVNSLTPEAMAAFMPLSIYFKVAIVDGNVAGFLIGLGPDSIHTSSNYRWFQKRRDDFIYVDRIVIAATARGRGLGRRLYADFARGCGADAAVLACEVNIRPRNQESLDFHSRLGFTAVGEHTSDEGKRVVMLERTLPW